MPNRIVREGINTSERVNMLGYQAEVLYRRLMNVVDDYGRFDARPGIVRSSCFPLRLARVREADISRWIAECENAGLIALYRVQGKPFLELKDFRQPIRAKSKWPAPPWDTDGSSAAAAATSGSARNLKASASNCAHSSDAHTESDSDAQRRLPFAETGPPGHEPRLQLSAQERTRQRLEAKFLPGGAGNSSGN